MIFFPLRSRLSSTSNFCQAASGEVVGNFRALLPCNHVAHQPMALTVVLLSLAFPPSFSAASRMKLWTAPLSPRPHSRPYCPLIILPSPSPASITLPHPCMQGPPRPAPPRPPFPRPLPFPHFRPIFPGAPPSPGLPFPLRPSE